MAFGFEIKNLSRVLKDIRDYSEEVKQRVDDELTVFAYNVVRDAQQLAPVDDGNLRAQIAVTRDEPFNKQIESGAEYSAYVEFGTGTNVNVPDLTTSSGSATVIENLQLFAMQYKGAGLEGRHPVKFKDGNWRMVPYQLNLRPQPFYFPAIQKNAVELPRKLKGILEQK